MFLLASGQLAMAVSPTPPKWPRPNVGRGEVRGHRERAEPDVGLFVLANNDPVQPNGRDGKPLQIGDKQYARGLCSATP